MDSGSRLLVMGISSSGKTTIGRLLAARLGWRHTEATLFGAKRGFIIEEEE